MRPGAPLFLALPQEATFADQPLQHTESNARSLGTIWLNRSPRSLLLRWFRCGLSALWSVELILWTSCFLLFPHIWTNVFRGRGGFRYHLRPHSRGESGINKYEVVQVFSACHLNLTLFNVYLRYLMGIDFQIGSCATDCNDGRRRSQFERGTS